MKYLYLSFIFNIINKNVNHLNINMVSELHKESFVGSWIVYEEEKKDIIHFQSDGSVYKPSSIDLKKESEYIGSWNIKKDIFYFNNKNKNYYGKLYNNSLKITGNVCEGLYQPCYVTNFTLIPLFEQFHNITYVNNSNNIVYLTQNNVTGTWLLENINTNQIYILELHKNNTWNSLYSNKEIFRGKWNLFNESYKINTNKVIKLSGKNIWLSIIPKKYQCYSSSDIMFLGKITQLGNIYYYDKNMKSTTDENNKLIISSKINGSVVYCYDADPEISENFYMKRWF